MSTPDPLHVAVSPCTSCPYAKSTPPGVWHKSEYLKLPGYDDPQTAFETFLCHHSAVTDRQSVCRGWLTVHAESVAARLATSMGLVTDDERYAPVKEELYASGAEACAAGIAGITRPSAPARRVIDRLNTARQRARAKRRAAKGKKRRSGRKKS